MNLSALRPIEKSTLQHNSTFNMNALRIIGRVIIAFFVLAAGLRTALTIWRLILLFQSQSPTSEAISGGLGSCVGSFLILMFFVWLFRKLGKEDSKLKPPVISAR